MPELKTKNRKLKTFLAPCLFLLVTVFLTLPAWADTPTTLVSGLSGPFRIAIDPMSVYWIEGGMVKKVSINGGEVTILASGLSGPQGIAVDSTNVYWTDSSGTVNKVGINGGTITTLASGLSGPQDIAVDSTNVYWTGYMSSGTVKKVGINGGTITTLVSGLSWPYGIAIDSTNVYWTEPGSGTVKKVTTNGGTVTTLASGQISPYHIAIDSTNVYWTPNGSTPLNKVTINGGTVTTLVSQNTPGRIVVDSTNVYWVESGTGTVKKVNVNGGPVTTLATGLSYPYDIAVDSTNVYWIENTGGTVKKINKNADTTAPTGSITINSGVTDTTSTAAALNLSASDGNGVIGYYVSEDSTVPSASATGWTSVTSTTSYSANISFTLSSGDGTKTVYVWFKDGAGNVSSAVNDSIILDTTAPTTTASPAGGTYSATQGVTLTCSDGTGSGCDKIYYTTDGTTPTTSSSVYSTPISISASTTLKFFAKDLIGNEEGVKTEVYTINISIATQNIAAGGYHTVAIKCDDSLWAWGSNSTGQLGDGTTTFRYSPGQISSETFWSAVAAGNVHTVAVQNDGTIWTWGGNASGQLGDGTWTAKYSPVQIGTETIWSAVAAGEGHTVALKNNGTLWAWGNNTGGALGDGTTTNRYTPVQIGTDTTWRAVAAGGIHTIALKNNGTLWAWGYNFSGQVGDGTTTNRYTPVQIGTDTTWRAVAAGHDHTIALKSDGTLWAWGYNYHGQLGDGTTTNRSSPVQIGTGTNWSQIAAGYYHTVAIKDDGTLWAWGHNSSGQLGDGTTTDRNFPVQIGSNTNWSQIAAGDNHSVAIKSDGTLWAWGFNSAGQLGDGTTTYKTTPTKITEICDTTAPTTTASPAGGTYTSAQIVTLTCSDGTGSGCDKIYYTIDGSTPTTLSTVYTTPITISSTTTLKFFAKDLAGNSETVKSEAYTLDTTPPTGTISINSGAAYSTSASVILTLSCTDDSGCAEMQFSNDNTNWLTAEAYSTSKTWSLASGDGSKTVYVKFKDTAGNWSTAAISDTIVLDTTAPTTTASPAGGTYTSAQSVTLTCSDGTGSGCDKIYYTTDGSTPTTLSTVYTSPITVSSTTTLKFFAKDLVGNGETVRTEVYTVTGSSGDSWTTKASMPTANYWLSSTVVSGVIYTIGWSYNQAFDPATNSWSVMATVPTLRVGLSASTVNGVAYAIGGNGGGSSYYSTVEAYDPATNSWSTKSPMSTARSEFSTSVVNGLIYAIGGYNYGAVYSSMEAYDPVTNAWTAKSAMPTARMSFSSSVVNGVIYAIGGGKDDITSSTVEAYNATGAPATICGATVAAGAWTSACAAMPTARNSLSTSVLNGVIYAMGGWNGTNELSIVEAFDPATNSWSTKAAMPAARQDFSTSVVNGVIYAFGGSSAETWAYTPPLTADTTPPTGTISINSGAASTNSTTATLTLSCTDTNGCSEMQFSNDNSTWSTAETYTTSKTWTLTAGDGTKTVYAKFKDTAGNWSTAYSDTIVLDTAAPDTSITNQPSNPTNSTSASFSFTSTETGSTFQCQLDSGGYSSCTSPASYTSLSDGSHTFYVKATDTAGNTDTTPASYTWTIDTTAPTVTINAVTTPTSSTSQTITGTVETGATVNVSRDTAASDGAAIVTGTTWSYTITGLVEGANNITVTATDAAGNTAMATAVVVLDTIVPVLTLSTLSNNSVTNNNTLNISGTATDNTGVQGLTINGNPVTINADGSFSHALILNEGANVITTVATDLTGNQTTDTRTITLDITAPALVIDTPADNSKTAASIATVTGTIDENSTVAVTLNGGTPQYASVTGSTFTLDIVLASGVNTIEVTATDTAGNTSTEKRTVTYDNTKPSLEITEPNQDIRTNQGSIIIKGAISDALTAVSVSVTVDGNTYNPAISNGQFEQAVTFIAEKTYTVTVTATDEAGNTTTAQRNIIYDITQPVINFTTTTPTNNTSQTITGTMEEGATVTVTSVTATVGTVTYPSSTTWRVNVTGMTEGSNTITATAKDTAGNETTVAKQIVVDTVAPVTTATPGGGTYSSAQGVTLVTNETATIYYTTDGTTPTTSSTVYVFPISITKTTTLKYFAKDRAGNRSAVSSETYTINPVSAIDTTPPSNVSYLNATSNADGSISLSWTAPTDADLKGYSVYRDSVKINSEAITKSTVTYTDTDTVSGTVYTYKVTSLDMAGNESTGVTKSIAAVAQDNTPPSAVSSIKVEDTKTGGSLKVVWTANTEADLSGYKVYLGTSSGSYTNTYEAGNTTAYTVTGLNDGAKYYIAVTAYDTDGNESAKSVESTESPTTATITLNPPTNLTVTTGNEYITLSWTGVSNVTGYLVYIGNTDGAYGTSARTTNTTYTYSNLNNNQTYYVAVSSYTNNGSSDTISAESERTASSGTPSDNNPPSSPTNITATTGTSGSVSLKWDRAEDSDISGYMLAYKESGSSTFTGMVSISAQWSYTITGLTDGVTYDFYLYAYDKNGNFSEPATTSATPTNSGSTADLTPPSPPILSAVPGDKKVTLIITASSDTDIDIDHYNLYVYNLASEKYMPLTSINGLTYEHSEGVGNGEALVYVATAVDASGNESGYSEAASAVANELPGDIPLEEDPPVADRVDGYDVNEMAKGFGTEIGDLDYNPNADLTGDGTVDGDDLLILGTNHGKKKE